MSNIERYAGPMALTRDARKAARSISRYQSGGQVRTAAVDVETDVAIAKVEAQSLPRPDQPCTAWCVSPRLSTSSS